MYIPPDHQLDQSSVSTSPSFAIYIYIYVCVF